MSEPVESPEWTYAEIIRCATYSYSFRAGLRAAAAVCRAQGRDPHTPSCPSGIAAAYIDRLADGEMP